MKKSTKTVSIAFNTVILALTVVGLSLCMLGCGDGTEGDEDINLEGILPAGPKFCSSARPPAPFACRGESGACNETLPEAVISVEAARQECQDDGGELVRHCTVDVKPVLGACVEGSWLRFAYEGDSSAQGDCEADQFEWVACPTATAP